MSEKGKHILSVAYALYNFLKEKLADDSDWQAIEASLSPMLFRAGLSPYTSKRLLALAWVAYAYTRKSFSGLLTHPLAALIFLATDPVAVPAFSSIKTAINLVGKGEEESVMPDYDIIEEMKPIIQKATQIPEGRSQELYLALIFAGLDKVHTLQGVEEAASQIYSQHNTFKEDIADYDIEFLI